MEELYVYYKLAPEQLDAARDAFEQLRAALKRDMPGLCSRLLERPAQPGELQTWMETHAWPEGSGSAPVGWTAQLEALAAAVGGPSVDGRHVEVFVERC